MQKLIEVMNDIQSKCIGLFKNKYTKEFEMVINDREGVITTLSFGQLGGVSNSNYSISTDSGIFKRFPDNKSLLEMKEDIYGLDKFCKSF